MLTRMRVENFKAWSELDIALGTVTGLFGTNSSGKSSLIQMLLMLKQTKNATDRGLSLDFGGPDKLANLGTFRDVVHDHDESRAISWKLNWTKDHSIKLIDTTKRQSDTIFEGNELEIDAAVEVFRFEHEFRFRFRIVGVGCSAGHLDEGPGIRSCIGQTR